PMASPGRARLHFADTVVRPGKPGDPQPLLFQKLGQTGIVATAFPGGLAGRFVASRIRRHGADLRKTFQRADTPNVFPLTAWPTHQPIVRLRAQAPDAVTNAAGNT